MFVIASYCEEESKAAGINDAQIKAAIKLLTDVNEGHLPGSHIDRLEIEATKGTDYNSWHRIKPARPANR
jgi:hypothetical protein